MTAWSWRLLARLALEATLHSPRSLSACMHAHLPHPVLHVSPVGKQRHASVSARSQTGLTRLLLLSSACCVCRGAGPSTLPQGPMEPPPTPDSLSNQTVDEQAAAAASSASAAAQPPAQVRPRSPVLWIQGLGSGVWGLGFRVAWLAPRDAMHQACCMLCIGTLHWIQRGNSRQAVASRKVMGAQEVHVP